MGSITSQTLAAPGPTQLAALLALAVGVAGFLLAALRALYLGAASRRLARSKAEWETLATITKPQGFRRLMEYLERSRSATGSEPQEVWRAALDQLMAREEQWEGFLRALISVAVLLGLLGTVLGFMSLAPALTRHALDQLDAKLGGVFIGTGAGILSALLIYLVALPWLRSATVSWAACVEDAGRIALLPLLPRPPTKIQDLVLDELTRRLDAVAQAWVSTLAEPARALRDEVGAAATSVQQISDALRAVEITSGDLKALAASARGMGTAAKSMVESSMQFATGAQHLDTVAGGFGQQLGSLATVIETNRTQTAALGQTLAEGRAVIEREGTELHAALARIAENFEQLAGLVHSRMNEEAGVSQEARRAVERLADVVASTEKALAEMADNAHEMNLAAAKLATSAGETQDRIVKSLQEHLERWTSAQQLLMQPIARQLTGLPEALGEAREHLKSAAESVSQIGHEFSALVRAEISSVGRTAAEAVNRLDTKMQQILEAARPPTNSPLAVDPIAYEQQATPHDRPALQLASAASASRDAGQQAEPSPGGLPDRSDADGERQPKEGIKPTSDGAPTELISAASERAAKPAPPNEVSQADSGLPAAIPLPPASPEAALPHPVHTSKMTSHGDGERKGTQDKRGGFFSRWMGRH